MSHLSYVFKETLNSALDVPRIPWANMISVSVGRKLTMQRFSLLVAGVYSCFLSCRHTHTQYCNTCLKRILILTVPENSEPYAECFPVPRDRLQGWALIAWNEELWRFVISALNAAFVHTLPP